MLLKYIGENISKMDYYLQKQISVAILRCYLVAILAYWSGLWIQSEIKHQFPIILYLAEGQWVMLLSQHNHQGKFPQ